MRVETLGSATNTRQTTGTLLPGVEIQSGGILHRQHHLVLRTSRDRRLTMGFQNVVPAHLPARQQPVRRPAFRERLEDARKFVGTRLVPSPAHPQNALRQASVGMRQTSIFQIRPVHLVLHRNIHNRTEPQRRLRTQLPLPVRLQGLHQDLLRQALGTAPARSRADPCPAGRLITPARMRTIHMSIHQHRHPPVPLPPVGAQTCARPPQGRRSQTVYPNPGQDQKTGVVQHLVQMCNPCPLRPANPLISLAFMPARGMIGQPPRTP